MPWILCLFYGYARQAQWMGRWGLAYGVHVTAMMPALLGHFALSNNPRKWEVCAIYAPYALVPALMVVRFAATGADPFPVRAARAQRAKQL